MAHVGLQELLVAGCHFGHLTRRWNPKMKKFIFMERSGIHIIDLKKTEAYLREACEAVARVIRAGDKVLFVGTKKQAKDIVRAEAERCGQFFVTERWL
ncbi:MAG: 30S ribosomal protein S2, partial [Candidatus Oleimicrobiaceae bacterium]